MDNQQYVYQRFIKIILPICVLAFVVTITLFELTNYHRAHGTLLKKLDKLSATYSLLYAEPVATSNMELIRSYSIALISDPEIAMVRIEDSTGKILDDFSTDSSVKPEFVRTRSIDFADEQTYHTVGSLTLAVNTDVIESALADRIMSEVILLMVLMLAVVASVGIAFQRAIHSSLSKLTHEASHDPLTDLVNRRAFEQILSNHLRHRRITDHYHKLLYLDLDGFKQINDNNGHIAGDEMLIEVANILQQHTRNEDVIARLGGDEFALLLMNCSTEKALSISTLIQASIENHDFTWMDKEFRIGISIGIATINDRIANYEDYIRMADEACYAAKRSGTNHIQLYETIDESSAA